MVKKKLRLLNDWISQETPSAGRVNDDPELQRAAVTHSCNNVFRGTRTNICCESANYDFKGYEISQNDHNEKGKIMKKNI